MWNVHVVNVYSRVYLLFQAEDGILDYKVTGVQTCALPIYLRSLACERSSLRCDGPRPHHEDHKDHEDPKGLRDLLHIHRSEERRVGIECIYRLSQLHIYCYDSYNYLLTYTAML